MIVDEVGVELDGPGGTEEGGEGEASVGADGGWAIARSSAEAPEIDGTVRVPLDGWDLSPGDLIEVDIVGSDEHDLVGRVPED